MMVREGGWFQGAALPSFTGRIFSYYFCMICQEIFFARQERARRGQPVTRDHSNSHGSLARQFGRCSNRGRGGGKKRGKGGEVSALMASASNKKPRKAPVSRHECLKKGAFVAFDGFWVARRLGRVWFWSGPSPLVLGLNRYGL